MTDSTLGMIGLIGMWEGLIILIIVIAPVAIAVGLLIVYLVAKRKPVAVPASAGYPRSGQCERCGTKLASDAPQGLCPRCVFEMGMGTQVVPSPEGRSFKAPPPEELATQFPQFEILELLGRGGMGAVYRARQKDLDRVVALKVMPPEAGRDPAFAERFTREGRALARLNHPHIVAVHDSGRAGDYYYFVMEFVDGLNLRQLLQAQKLSPKEAMGIVPQICEALQYAHDQGIVHRDIKPENVLVDKQGRVKIADFGLARLLGKEPLGARLTRSAEIMGTPQYMAPEQLEKPLDVDHRADIYSLGVIFYEMLTGELPLGKFAPPSRKVQVDVRLDEVVLRALEKEPALRYQQASQLGTRVETIASGGAGTSGDAAQARALAPGLEAAHKQVRIPAIGLMATAGINFLVSLVVLGFWGLKFLGLPAGFSFSFFGLILMVAATFLLVVLAFILPALIGWGARHMWRLQSYGFALAASILALLVPPGLVIGLVFGIWALVVLNRPEVRGAFVSNAATSTQGGKRSGWLVPVLVIAVVLILPLVGMLGLGLLGNLWMRISRAPTVRSIQAPIAVPAPARAPRPATPPPGIVPLTEPGESNDLTPADVAAVPVQERFAGDDPHKRYELIGETSGAPPADGYRLLVVLPGGDGGSDFQPFLQRVYQNALPKGYLVAELVAPRWDEQQFKDLVWPTEKNPYPAMQFSTESFVDAVIADLAQDHPLDARCIYTLSWSSGGPAGYAVSLHPDSRVTGTFVAMSMFRPEQLPALDEAAGHAYYLMHSPQDFIPIRMAETAREQLSAHGANVELHTYAGGHGWHGKVYEQIRTGVEWLESRTAASAKETEPE